MIYLVLHTLFAILFVYLCFVVLYLLACAIVGHLNRREKHVGPDVVHNIAVLITSYKEDAVIVNTALSAARHDYPPEKFSVFIAADQLEPDTIDALRRAGAAVYVMDFERGSKARSLNYLLNTIPEQQFQIAMILDGDNLMQPGLLRAVSAAYSRGNHVIQTHRTAKNLDSPIAVLDALSEEVNNHLFRQAPANLGISASLIGSGMAFPFKLLKDIYNMPGILDNPACDRVVDFEMLVSGQRVHYLHDVHVLDEKVSTSQVYKNQRRRWLESQLMHAGLFFSKSSRVKTKNADYWNKLFVTLLPPRVLLLAAFMAVLCICVLQAASGTNITGLPFAYWLLLFLLFVIALLISIPRSFFNRHTVMAFLHLPRLLYTLLRAAFSIEKKRKEFIHTPKTYTGSSAYTEHEK